MHEMVVRMLLGRRDIDVNSTDAKGRTPLIIAALFNRVNLVKILLIKYLNCTMKFTANLEFFIFLLSTAHAEKGNYPRYSKEIIDSGPKHLFQN